MELFTGVSVGAEIAKAFAVDTVVSEKCQRKDKQGKLVFRENKEGKRVAVMQGARNVTTIAILPRKSEDGDSLASVTDYTGQQLMGFETQARSEGLKALWSAIAPAVMSGELVLKSAKKNNLNGSVSIHMKRAAMRVMQVTPDQALKVLGITEEQLAALKGASEVVIKS